MQLRPQPHPPTEGQMMRPYGPSFRWKGKAFSCSRANMMSGRQNTSVFPDPVKAMPIMSRPDKLWQVGGGGGGGGRGGEGR